MTNSKTTHSVTDSKFPIMINKKILISKASKLTKDFHIIYTKRQKNTWKEMAQSKKTVIEN